MKKNLRTPMGITALVGLSLSLAPAGAFAAEAAPIDASTAIGAYWEKNKDALGAAVDPQECFTNGACEQVFENGVVTHGKWGGVQSLMGEAGQTFTQAGGAEKFGNAEGQPWNHTYCGSSVTAHDGKTRWLVVLDSKTQAGSFIDLNSAESKQWVATRAQDRSCFPNNAVVEETPVVDATAQAAADKIADARAVANANAAGVGEALAAPVKVTEDLYTQDFGSNVSGLYSVSQDRAVMINTDALQVYLANPAKYGSYLYMNEFYPHDAGVQIHALFYTSADRNCEATHKWQDHGYALYTSTNGEAVLAQYYQQNNEYIGECFNYNNDTVAAPVAWPTRFMDRTPGAGAVDTTYDWSQAKLIEIQQVLELRVNESTVVYIKADANGKPLAGATPVESSALSYTLELSDRGRFSAYNEWVNGGSYNIWSATTMLGAPVGEAVESVVDGEAIVTQEFEGGNLVWFKDTPHTRVDLNELGKAKLAWYEDLR